MVQRTKFQACNFLRSANSLWISLLSHNIAVQCPLFVQRTDAYPISKRGPFWREAQYMTAHITLRR